MDARFHQGLAWIAAAAIVGGAACAGSGGGPSKGGGGTPGGGTGPGGPSAGMAPACIGPTWFGSLDEAARARVTDLVCADARSGNLAANRLTGDGGPSCAGQFKTSSDAEIAGILAAYDEGQMRQSNFAETNATAPAVRDFAHEMSAAHARSSEEQKSLFDRGKIKRNDTAISRALSKGFDDAQTSLKAAAGPSFDKEFMARQIVQHARALEMLDQLAGQAKNDDVRCSIDKDRDVAMARLQLACLVLADLGGATAPPMMSRPAGNRPPPANARQASPEVAPPQPAMPAPAPMEMPADPPAPMPAEMPADPPAPMVPPPAAVDPCDPCP